MAGENFFIGSFNGKQDVKVGVHLGQVRAYVEKQDYMSKEQKQAIFNFINDDVDHVVSNPVEAQMIKNLLSGDNSKVKCNGLQNPQSIERAHYSGTMDPGTEREYTYYEDVTTLKTGNVEQEIVYYEQHSKNPELDGQKSRGNTLKFNHGKVEDHYIMDKNGIVDSRRTTVGNIIYYDYNMDGQYDEKWIYDPKNKQVAAYKRTEKGGWQLDE